MREVEVAEAQRSLGTLLEAVERGDEIAIVENGRRLARLLPPDPSPNTGEAARRIRERRKGVSLGGLSTEELVAEGRK